MHTLYVVRGEGPNLLKRDRLKHIQMDRKSLGVARWLRSLLPCSKYFACMNGCLQMMNLFKAKLMVKPESSPLFCWARPLLFVLKEPSEIVV